jgi:beta-phosphoglucomutase
MNFELKGVVFDFDGVLVDSHPVHMRAWKRFFASMGRTVSEVQLQFVLDGRRRDDILRHFLGELDDDKIVEYGLQKERIFQNEASDVQTIDGLLGFLEDLEGAKLILGVASSGSRKRVDFLLRKLELKRHFQVVITGEEVAHSKPDPALFLKAAQGLGVEPFELVAFEDAVSGVRAARSAGMNCVGIAELDRASDLLDAGAMHVVPNFRPLSYSKLRELLSNGAGSSVMPVSP